MATWRQSFSRLSGAVATALLSGSLAWAPLAIADNGRDFAGTYRVEGSVPLGSPIVTVTLAIRLQNVSGTAVTNAVVELDGLPPAPLAQSFPMAITVPDRGFVTVRGTFAVRSLDAKRWQSGIAPAPAVVLIGSDQAGKASRRNVELISQPAAMQ
jgi:hypothetical protein